MALSALSVLKGLAAVAGAVSKAKEILSGDEQLDETLDEALGELQTLKGLIVTGIADILEAIDGIRRQINEDVAFDNLSLADRALFSDLRLFGDHQEAMGNSFQAADRLRREDELVFGAAFMYVVNLRHAVIKACVEDYRCQEQFREEFDGYISQLEDWIEELNRRIAAAHTVAVDKVVEQVESPGPGPGGSGPGPPKVDKTVGVVRFWVATHRRDGVEVDTFVGPIDDVSQAAREQVARQARASRQAGIEVDREELGVVAMEDTAAAWSAPFDEDLRVALARQVLNRPVAAIERDPRGLMVDGTIQPVGPDLRASLQRLLASREFRGRIRRSWQAFVDGEDDRFVQFAYRRLFDRAATDEETGTLREVATRFGYEALIAVLLNSDAYDERFARGLPGGGTPVAEALRTTDQAD